MPAADHRAHAHLLHRQARALTLTVLGSAGTFAYPGNPCSGYLLRTTTTSIWLDAGPGTFAALQEHIPLAEVDAIVLSHEHPDHWIELPVVRNAARYVMGIDHLAVFGTAGTRRLAEAVIGTPLPPPIEWTEISDGSAARIGDINLRFAVTDHPVETLAVRVEAHGRVMAYSADTGPAWSFAALDPEGLGFDLALCEATLAEAEEGVAHHLSGEQAGAMARAAGVRRLAITHLYEDVAGERVDAASGDHAFDGPVEVALSGHTFTV
ncbi:MAG: MBL fold metallo-hydrolase [Aquihabitans sp.]